ncbi:MAG TPA: LPS assembly protein LptD [Geomonas sp.]|nr:LPS assembly protein LptD [Geomonas sp.]
MKPARACWLLVYLLAASAPALAGQPAPASASAAPTAPVQAGPAAPAGAAPTAAPATAAPAATGAGSTQPEATGTPPASKPAAAGAATTPAAAANPKEVNLKADSLYIDVPSDSYVAKGDVRAVQNGMSLLADSIIYGRLSGDALAEGNVFFEKDGDTLKGDRISLNMFSEQGEVNNATLFVKKSNFYMRGKKLEKTGDQEYRVENGSFTTCDGDHPSWRFEARKVQVTLDEFATARDAVFYVGDIPLLYTPYLLFPVTRERQSGLLLPKFGHSSKKGYYLFQPYYWAIDQSQDATFDLDLESNRGAGLGVDYRYIRARGSEGSLQGFGIFDTQQSRFRGEIDQNHLELLSPNTTLSSNIHLVTDRSYYLDYGELAGDYNRQLLESTVSFSHKWDRYGFAGELRYTEALQGADENSTLQRLPSLSFTGAGDKLGQLPVFFSMNSSLINFQRSEGVNGQRLEIHPRLTLYQKPAGLLDLSVYGGYRERVYNANGADAPDGVQHVIQSDAGGTLSLPLERIYGGTVRHLLIPSIQYSYAQSARDDNVPFFDYNDRVLGQSVAGWSLANVVTRKFTTADAPPEYRDLVYLKLSQGYQFSGQRRDLLTLVDAGHHLNDLQLESRVSPLKNVAIALDGRYNTVDNNITSADLTAEWKEEGKEKASKEAAITYRFSRHAVDYLEGHVSYPVMKQLSASVIGRYSFDNGGFLESRYSLEYKRQCWSVIALYADRPGTPTIPGNREFTINFALYGIGALGPVRAF